MYEISGLKRGISQAYKNIATFEAAIQKERETIAEYERMIAVLERKAEEADGVAEG